jgi:ketosteroid isomerase-like protein
MSLILFLLLWHAAPAQHAPAEAVPVAIRQILDAQVAAWNRGDIDAFMAGYWRSPQTEFVGANGITRGWAATRAHYLAGYPNRAAMGHLAFRRLEIEPLCANAAYVTGFFRLTRGLPRGRSAGLGPMGPRSGASKSGSRGEAARGPAPVNDSPHGVFTLLFRRFPEGWRIVSDHTTAAAQ